MMLLVLLHMPFAGAAFASVICNAPSSAPLKPQELQSGVAALWLHWL